MKVSAIKAKIKGVFPPRGMRVKPKTKASKQLHHYYSFKK
jgi:hypothetical protein